VASTFTTFTFTETVGAFGSVDAADESLAALLLEADEVCCANKVPLRQSANTSDVAAREIVIERKKVLDMKAMITTMPELQHVQGKGL
jgi:hypothetical protein